MMADNKSAPCCSGSLSKALLKSRRQHRVGSTVTDVRQTVKRSEVVPHHPEAEVLDLAAIPLRSGLGDASRQDGYRNGQSPSRPRDIPLAQALASQATQRPAPRREGGLCKSGHRNGEGPRVLGSQRSAIHPASAGRNRPLQALVHAILATALAEPREPRQRGRSGTTRTSPRKASVPTSASF